MAFHTTARRAGIAAVAAAMLATAAPAALAAPRCANPADQTTFEIEALKSELMVASITCRREDRYNAFVERYRPVLVRNNQEFSRYFSAARGGRSAGDSYVTNLAQMRGHQAQMLGSDFCPRNLALFDEVMALPNTSDLGAYAAGKHLFHGNLSPCEGGRPGPISNAVRRAAARRSR